MAAANKKVVRRRRERKNVEKGAVHIRSSFNNTMVVALTALPYIIKLLGGMYKLNIFLMTIGRTVRDRTMVMLIAREMVLKMVSSPIMYLV